MTYAKIVKLEKLGKLLLSRSLFSKIATQIFLKKYFFSCFSSLNPPDVSTIRIVVKLRN